MIRVIIVDDEKPAREELKFLLSGYTDIHIVGEAEDGTEALRLVDMKEPDLIFLDIQMPEISGIELAKQLTKRDPKPAIIFLTAYENYAIGAFEVNGLDYLLKPVEKDRLAQSVKRARLQLQGSVAVNANMLNSFLHRLQGKNDQHLKITVSKEDCYIPLDPDDIIYIAAEGKYTRIVTGEGEFIHHKTITDLEYSLAGHGFFRCHRSYIINLNYIKKIGQWFNNTYQLQMLYSEEKIPVARHRTSEFKILMNMD